MAKPESHGVFVEDLPKAAPAIAGAATAITAFVGAANRGPMNKAVRVKSFAEFEERFGGVVDGVELGYAVRQFFLNGGTEAYAIRIARKASLATTIKGMAALDKIDLFNLLVLPGVAQPDILQRAAAYCEAKRALFLLDPPTPAITPAEMEQMVREGTLPKSNQAAVFYPWVQISDPGGSGSRLFPPASAVAGLFARLDNKRGVWKPAAGAEASLVNVRDVPVHLSETQMNRLNSSGVNCLRRLPAGSVVLWGARMLGADSEWKYIPVRRLGLFIEASVSRGTQWAKFEPNNERLWQQIRDTVGAFLQTLLLRGALLGATPRQAYFVKCGLDTMTAAEIGEGVLNVEIGFAPQRPAEFVVIKLQSMAASP